MKDLKHLYDCEPPQFVRPETRADDRVTFFKRFCDEQPGVVTFLTKYGTSYAESAPWTAFSINQAQKIWWNYIANDVSLPPVSISSLEQHYLDNKEFVETKAAPARDKGFMDFSKVCQERTQSSLRLLVMATVFDATQHPIIGATDTMAGPDLVRDQNHVHGLLGAVIDAFDEVAVEQPEGAIRQ